MAAVLVASGASAIAQTEIEYASDYVRLLMGYSILHADATGYSSTENDKGFHFGLHHGVSLSKGTPIYFEYGIDGQMAFHRESSLTEKVMSLAIPGQYSCVLGNEKCSVQPFAGIHMKYNVLAKLTEDNSGAALDYFNREMMEQLGLEPFNRFQLGFQVGAGLNINECYLGYEFRRDITCLQVDSKMKCSSHMITFGITY